MSESTKQYRIPCTQWVHESYWAYIEAETPEEAIRILKEEDTGESFDFDNTEIVDHGEFKTYPEEIEVLKTETNANGHTFQSYHQVNPVEEADG